MTKDVKNPYNNIFWKKIDMGHLVWFLCFNGISTFEGYLMPYPSL